MSNLEASELFMMSTCWLLVVAGFWAMGAMLLTAIPKVIPLFMGMLLALICWPLSQLSMKTINKIFPNLF